MDPSSRLTRLKRYPHRSMGVGITVSATGTICPTMATRELGLCTTDLVWWLYQRRDALERVELSLVEIHFGNIEVEFLLQECHDLQHVQRIDSPGKDQGVLFAKRLVVSSPAQDILDPGANLLFSFHGSPFSFRLHALFHPVCSAAPFGPSCHSGSGAGKAGR